MENSLGHVGAINYVNLTFPDSQPFESRVALYPGLGGVRDVTSAIISLEQTQ